MWSPDGDFQVAYDAADADAAEAFAAWEAEIAHGRRIEAAAQSLDVGRASTAARATSTRSAAS